MKQNHKHSTAILFLLLTCYTTLQAQQDSLWHQKATLHLSGFADIFYAYDFGGLSSSRRQTFLYHHNRHNEFNLNLGLIKLRAEHPKFKADLALQAGTYVEDNYAAEPTMLKIIHEAHCAVAINKKNTAWIDAGMFPSHIGLESAQSMDNWTLTRSIAAENSPYFLSGMKITYQHRSKWTFSGLLCNGWQRIQRVTENSAISFGSQVKYSPSDRYTFNWSTFIGSDDPDSTRRIRAFNNLYANLLITPKLGIQAGFDIGIQQRSKGSTQYDTWFSPLFIMRYITGERWQVSFRSEYYQDFHGVIIAFPEKGFRIWGSSFNVDLTPAHDLICRLEGRWMRSDRPIFDSDGKAKRYDLALISSIAVRF